MSHKPNYYVLAALVVSILAILACNTVTGARNASAPAITQQTSCVMDPNSTGAPSANFNDRFDAAQDKIWQANSLMQQKQFAEAILCWDNVLIQVPEYANAYYQRSQSYWNLTSNQRVQTEYEDYLTHALSDINQAILLNPEMGDYYFARYEIENAFAGDEMYLVDKNFWYTQAYDDMALANHFGTKGELADRNPAFLLVNLGRCDEALDEFNRLLDSHTGAPSAGLNTGLAFSSHCLGKYDDALKYIDTAISLYPSFEREFERATILYDLGRLDEALDQINKTIEDRRYYCGCRYYFRALIYYDQGKKDLAQADIDFGTTQTWGRGGIRPYVLGRLALDAGDQQQGIALLQEAAASLTWDYSSLRKRVQQELRALGANPLSLSVSVPATPAPFPVTPQIQPPTPTTIPLGQPVGIDAKEMSYSNLENDPITFMPGKSLTFHFVPPEPLEFASVEQLVVTVWGGPLVRDRIMEIDLWRPTYNDWPYIISKNLGAIGVENGGEFVTSTGDIYVCVSIRGDQPTLVNTIGITLIVRNADGSSNLYGMTTVPR